MNKRPKRATYRERLNGGGAFASFIKKGRAIIAAEEFRRRVVCLRRRGNPGEMSSCLRRCLLTVFVGLIG